MKPVTDPALLASLDTIQPVDEEMQRLLEQREIGQDAFQALSPREQIGHGAIKSVTETGYGLQDLLSKAGGVPLPGGGTFRAPWLDQDQKDELEQLQAVSGPYAALGEVGADVATMAIPGLGVEAGVGKAITKLPRLAKALARYGTTVGTAAGEEALKAPVADRSRSDRAQSAAIGSAVAVPGFAAGGRALRRMLAGRPSAEAQDLISRGIPVTTGRSSGGVRKSLENVAEVVPFMGKAIENRVDEGVGAWNRDLLQKVNPISGRPIEAAGADGFRQVQENFSEAYNRVWQNVKPQDVSLAKFRTDNLTDAVPADESAEVLRRIERANAELGRFKKTGSTDALERLDDMLRPGDLSQESNQVIRKYRDQFRGSLPQAAGRRIGQIDGKYRNLITLEKAQAYKGAQEAGIFSPGQLRGATTVRTPNRQLAAGKTQVGDVDLMNEANIAGRVFGEELPRKKVLRRILGTGGTAAAGLVATSPTLAALAAGRTLYGKGLQKLLTDPQAGQKGLAAALRGLGYTGGAVNDLLDEKDER